MENVGSPMKIVGLLIKIVGSPIKKVDSPMKKVGQPIAKVGSPMKNEAEPVKYSGSALFCLYFIFLLKMLFRNFSSDDQSLDFRCSFSYGA